MLFFIDSVLSLLNFKGISDVREDIDSIYLLFGTSNSNEPTCDFSLFFPECTRMVSIKSTLWNSLTRVFLGSFNWW